MPILHSYYQDVYRCPIVRLDGYSAQHGLSTGILAYLDFGGATGSSKDGLAETMLAFATERGTLQPGMPVVEASSGSFGAALAVSCATTGHPCILVVPSNLPIAQRKRLQDLGAHIIACSSSGRRAMERVAEDTAKRYGGYYTHYFSNDDNPEYHRRVTGPQIYKNAGDAIDAIVIGVGSGGTITGVAEYIKAWNSMVRIVAVEPAECAAISGGFIGQHGISGIGPGFVPENYNPYVVDTVLTVTTADAERAAYLAKADLVTSAVVEFTSVQGVMGSYYAAACGEGDKVARAIADHYRPRFAGDALPASAAGRIVAMADKLDTICGLIAAGQGPTGSSDPFALRRSALGILSMLLDEGLPLRVGLVRAIDAALASYAAQGVAFDAQAVREEVADFFIARAKVLLRDEGRAPDTIDAVLAAGVREPVEFASRVRALDAAREGDPDAFADLATAFARANNLRDASLGAEVDEGLLSEVERALSCAVAQAESRVGSALAADDYPSALAELAGLRKPVDAFFEGVMVMDEDRALRENRLRLLNRFVAVFEGVADFGKMAKGAR